MLDAVISGFLLLSTILGAFILGMMVVLSIAVVFISLLERIVLSKMQRDARKAFLRAYTKPPQRVTTKDTDQFFDEMAVWRNGIGRRS